MVRPNSIIAVGRENTKPDYDYAEGVTLHVFELEEGKMATTTIINMSGKPELKVDIFSSNNRIDIKYEGGEKPFSILFRGVSNLKVIEGASCLVEELGTKVIPNKGVKAISCSM
jgi:alpha-D-xyloside xylohydrolase